MKRAFLSTSVKNTRSVHFFILLIFFELTVGTGCGGGTSSPSATGGTDGATKTTEGGDTPQTPTAAAGAVVSRVEQSGTVSYKIYFQETSSSTTRKGIVLLGSGNDPNDPSTGSLDGGLENNVANELAKLGYVAAIVAYRDEPPLGDWNSNCEMLATDMSNVADTLISTYGGADLLSRSKVVTGGVSYTSFALFTNIAVSTTLADTRGVLAVCGSTGAWDAQNFSVPIYSLNCSGNPSEGDLHGLNLINEITNSTIKADSGYFNDTSCPDVHCGGSTTTWTDKLVERTQLWLP